MRCSAEIGCWLPVLIWALGVRSWSVIWSASAVAASRAEDRRTTTAFLTEAQDSATRLGRDANAMWTAFGPTNVAIRRMTTAMELGDVQVAVELGPRVGASGLPSSARFGTRARPPAPTAPATAGTTPSVSYSTPSSSPRSRSSTTRSAASWCCPGCGTTVDPAACLSTSSPAGSTSSEWSPYP